MQSTMLSADSEDSENFVPCLQDKSGFEVVKEQSADMSRIVVVL
jgi:hypothetical protein